MSFSSTSAAAVQSGAGTAGRAGTAPIVLLTFPYSGAEALSDLVSSLPGIVCTSRTGVIPLCHAAADTWENIERRGERSLSPLAVASIRSLVNQMFCALAADSGDRRWCETVVSGTPVAETFLRIFPATRFICFYRRCDSVIADVLSRNPWGLGDTEFWRHFTAGQGNSVATIAAYWAERVQSLLDFETAHARSSMRVRLEHLEHCDGSDMDSLCEFLVLPPIHRDSSPAAPSVGPQTVALAGRIPPGIRQHVNELHSRLGYPAL
jgi:hypothetical protein